MAFANPSDATEILYGSSGDVRNEINAHLDVTTGGHYADEKELPGNLIVTSLRRSTRLINSYLEPVYADQIPFAAVADVPKLLDEVSSDIATFYVLRSLSAKVGPVSDEKRRDYFDQYVSEEPPGVLVLLRDRTLQLAELTASSPEDVKSTRGDYTPVFDLDRETSQAVDPDLIDKISEERDG